MSVYKLFYAEVEVGQFETKDACLAKAYLDEQKSFSIYELDANGAVVSVMSC